MNASEDTIAAIATAPGEGGISIVRMSGPRSFEIADKIFRCGGRPPSRRSGGTFVHGHVTDVSLDGRGTSLDVDEVLLLLFRSPCSYTCEDVIEVQGHGGRISPQRILRRLLDSGARLAEPGEFTRRAFLNGRLDLTQAEAVLDLVRASSDRAATAAMEQLNGSLSRWCTKTYSKLLSLVATLEAALDFPDDEMPPSPISQSSRLANQIHCDLVAMLATWNEGRILREGALTVISGKPNVGKSTLFNALLGTDRAIVADHPGTTRDTIEENLVIDGVLLRLVDTAGLCETGCDIEHQGVMRARAEMERADFHIHVLDASTPLDDADMVQLGTLSPNKTVVVLNKTDLGTMTRSSDIAKHTVISMCLLNAEAVDNLKTSLAGKLARYAYAPARATISERHRRTISSVSENVLEASQLLASGKEDTLVPAASLLRSGTEKLATLTGRTYYDDLLEQVFSRFCIGK